MTALCDIIKKIGVYKKMDKIQAISHFSKAISIPTISHSDPDQVDYRRFEEFAAFLKSAYPNMHAKLSCEKMARASLMYFWKGTGQGKPFAILGHMDVVPVDEETINEWKYPPLSGHFDGESVWGRGANDMKNHVVAVCEAIEDLLWEGFVPKRDIYILFSENEEAFAKENSGAQIMASTLLKRGVELEFVLDEGGAISSDPPMGIKRPAAMIGLAEKGYADVSVTVSSEGGHAAEPPKQVAITDMARMIEYMDAHPMKSRLTGTVKNTLKAIGRETGGILGLAVKALPLFKPIVMSVLNGNNMTAAMVKTTIAPTMINAGTVSNVLPQRVSCIFNVRLLPGDTSADVLEHFNHAAEKCGLTDKSEIKLVNTSEPPRETNSGAPTYSLMENLLKELNSDIVAIPYLVTGATDSREYVMVAKEIYRMYPFYISQSELAGMHGVNERLKADSFLFGIEFLKKFIQKQCDREVF